MGGKMRVEGEGRERGRERGGKAGGRGMMGCGVMWYVWYIYVML